jgi:LDH2 family malate/lactate/ureidoglycolate dehydrogenase
MNVVAETTASVDGDNGLGLVVGPKANQIAMDKAKKYGSGWVSVSNTNHYGIAGYYSLQALKQGMIGISMTNTTKLVVPCFGAERMLGTNPMAIAFPGQKEPPIVIDMATSVVAYGKVEEAHRMNKEMPEGWCVDKDGLPTKDPQAMKDGGALLTIGKDRDLGQHKGYCLSAMVDILCCVLSGANWGPYAPPFTLRDGVNASDERVGKGIGVSSWALFVWADDCARTLLWSDAH